MSQRISAAIGRPITAPSSVALTVSASQSFQVILLKPKRSSSLKVCQQREGQFEQAADGREGRQQRQLLRHAAAHPRRAAAC